MEIKITQLVGKEYIDKACSFTVNREVHPSLAKLYLSEHSPIRCSIFWIEMLDIPTFTSVHFVRHKIGCEHFVKSNRDDRGGDVDAGRWTPVNHAMLINAQALIYMSRKRLCYKSHEKTIEVMQAIKSGLIGIDPALASCMVPDCLYRGKCCEMISCKKMVNLTPQI